MDGGDDLARTMMGGDGAVCADCGATRCEAIFHACLAADFSDPHYGVVHHLVVPAYGLQHGWYPAGAEAGTARFLLTQLERPPSDHVRRSLRTATDGPVQVRARRPRERQLSWRRHVGDVDRDTADRYVATVRDWATATARALLADEPPAERRHADP